MAHYDTFRDQLAIAYPGFGSALWEPDPGEDSPPVQVGDVGYIRNGRFHRLFNARFPANHRSHKRYGVPEHHEELQPRLQDHIDSGTLAPNNFHSYSVTVASGGLKATSTGSIGSSRFSFSRKKERGAVLALPVTAKRQDTCSRDLFRTWITKHIDSWFAFSRHLELGIEMEDIVLVSGCHLTRSWSNIAFNAVQEDVQISLGVRVTSALCVGVNWQVSDLQIQGAVLNHRPNGEDLPKDQCIFIRGFRVKRILPMIPWTRIKAAAEPKPDIDRNDPEPEKEVVPIPSDTENRDPLRVLLEYIAQGAPRCDMAVVHDDDLERILGVGDTRSSQETSQPLADAMIDYLKRLKPEIEIMSDSFPTNDPSLGTNRRHMTVAMISEQLKSSNSLTPIPLFSHYPVHSDQPNRNVSGSSSGSTIPESELPLDDIVKAVDRFRILVIGRSGVGKSSLINCVFGINDARVEDQMAGEAEIEREFVSTQNQYFVLHNSKGFEPGKLSNFEIVRKFVEDRSKKELLKDRIHALWLCTETPTTGGRVFETGDEKLLQFAHVNKLPLVLVFTQYDRLVKMKAFQLRGTDLDPDTLRERSVEEAQETFKGTLKSLQVTMDKLKIPMPTYARVSVRKGYEKDVSYLVRVTMDVAKEQVMGDAWVLWSMAQRASLPDKIEASLIKGISYNVQALAGKVVGVGEWTLGACLQKVHKDIISCWNFRGEVLNSPEFQERMLRLVDDVHITPSAPRPNVDEANQMATLATSSTSVVPALPALSLGLAAPVRWLQSTLSQNFSETQRLLTAYVVDLIKVLIELFNITLRVELALTATWISLQEAFDAYAMSSSRQSIHDSIRSKKFMLTTGEIGREVHRLLEVDQF